MQISTMPVTAKRRKVSVPTVWTIGHSTRSLTHFLELLTSNDITTIADVRRFPGSRQYPQFNQAPLADSLKTAGIEYIAMPDLGGRRKARPDSHNTVWRNASFRGYADYMETDTFRSAINRLIALAREETVAIMCSEAVWWRCHRSMIADYLLSIGIPVRHIIDQKIEAHPYTAPAKVVNGKLTYASDDN